MEGEETWNYQVIITNPAIISFYEIIEYLYEHHPLDRAEEIADEIFESTETLGRHPSRGRKEERLEHRNKNYRYILYSRTSRAMVKIIYYVEQKTQTVYVTDFFPTEKDDQKIKNRNRY